MWCSVDLESIKWKEAHTDRIRFEWQRTRLCKRSRSFWTLQCTSLPSVPSCQCVVKAMPALLNSSTICQAQNSARAALDHQYVTYSCGWNTQGSSRSSPSCVKCGPRCRARRWLPLAARACTLLWETLWSMGSSSSCSWQIRDDSSPVPTHHPLCCSFSRRTGSEGGERRVGF